ncbi:MAG: hypothetical protein HKP58_15460 [Desulfatitalea sp.]|nr:hypothetical protein [Desulfatitalea sp.]NNK01807.1 hypothetical protein [Desulfatitalea sp.]
MTEKKEKKLPTTQGYRLPVVRTRDDVDALTHLSDEEKALAKSNLRWVMPSDGLWLLGSDPEVQALFNVYEQAVQALAFTPEDNIAMPFSPCMLMAMTIARCFRAEWVADAVSDTSAKVVGNLQKKNATHQHLAMLGFPDWHGWSDEQRLTIKFTEACYENNMTDDLFAQAMKTWGQKKLLRYLLYYGFVYQNALFQNVFKLRFEDWSGWMDASDVEISNRQTANIMKDLHKMYTSLAENDNFFD